MSRLARHDMMARSLGGMMRFSDEAWQQAAGLREAIHRLPFNTELAAGTLSRERFRFYILQDAIYLGDYARVLALAAAKATEIATLQAFASSALGAVAVEQALHGRYLQEFGVDPADVAAAEPMPDCLAYTSFLFATAYQKPWEVLVAATHVLTGPGASPERRGCPAQGRARGSL